jgi:hypothetical protein
MPAMKSTLAIVMRLVRDDRASCAMIAQSSTAALFVAPPRF